MESRAEVLANLGDYNGADFTVRKEPLHIHRFISDHSGIYQSVFDSIDSHIALVREDTNQVLSVVGKGYNPVDHVDAFKTAEEVIKLSDLDIKGITRKTECSHDGARAYSIYTLPEHKVNLGRENDDVALTISARNSFDGSWSFTVEVGGYRFICLNMQVFANNFAIHKSKHTSGLNLQRVADKLSEAVKFYDQETELWQEMVDTKVQHDTAMSILAYLADAKTVDSHLKSRSIYSNTYGNTMDRPFYLSDILHEPDVIRNKTLSSLWTRWLNNCKSLDTTAWALYNAMTEWATHQTPVKRNAIKNVASIKMDRLDKVRKTLNNKMLPALRLVA